MHKEFNKSDLIYNTNHSFYNYYRNSEEFYKCSPESKALVIRDFLINDINKLSDLKPRHDNTRKRKTEVFDKVSELYNSFLDKCFYEYYDLPSEKKKELGPENKPIKWLQ